MSSFVGMHGFLWFIAEVKSIDDPLKLGRVRIRINNITSYEENVNPTDKLLYATPIQPITSAAIKEKGSSPTGLLVGSTVVGFFADGKHMQIPMLMGTFAANPSYPDSDDEHEVNKLARGINKLTKTPDSTNGEPANPYAAEYPKNHVYESESGHIVEIDDTSNAERIHIYHKSGTFIEMHPNGDVVTHHKNGFRTVTGNDKLHVTGNLNIVVDENLTITAKNMTTTIAQSKTETAATGNVTYNSGEITVSGITHTKHTHVDNPGLAGARTTGPSG